MCYIYFSRYSNWCIKILYLHTNLFSFWWVCLLGYAVHCCVDRIIVLYTSIMKHFLHINSCRPLLCRIHHFLQILKERLLVLCLVLIAGRYPKLCCSPTYMMLGLYKQQSILYKKLLSCKSWLLIIQWEFLISSRTCSRAPNWLRTWP